MLGEVELLGVEVNSDIIDSVTLTDVVEIEGTLVVVLALELLVIGEDASSEVATKIVDDVSGGILLVVELIDAEVNADEVEVDEALVLVIELLCIGADVSSEVPTTVVDGVTGAMLLVLNKVELSNVAVDTLGLLVLELTLVVEVAASEVLTKLVEEVSSVDKTETVDDASMILELVMVVVLVIVEDADAPSDALVGLLFCDVIDMVVLGALNVTESDDNSSLVVTPVVLEVKIESVLLLVLGVVTGELVEELLAMLVLVSDVLASVLP